MQVIISTRGMTISRTYKDALTQKLAKLEPMLPEIIERYFEDLGRRRYQEIARAMKLPLDRVMESIEEIQGLEPKPGRRFGGND